MSSHTLEPAAGSDRAATVDQRVAVEVTDLRMRYGTNDVLHDVNFTIHRGEVLVLLGPNGAGKTTTIEILEGFRLPSAGRVSVLGENPATGDEAWRSRLGVVLQSWRDHGRWRVWELLDHLGSFYVPYSTSARPRPYGTEELLDTVGLTEHRNKKVSSLSGGQRRRLDVAIGIVGRPELLFLDEPTAGFDPAARRDFHDLVHGLSDLQDTTILLTTHDLDEAEKLADRILILNHGRIVANGSADELAHAVAGSAEVRWTQDGSRQVHATPDPTEFVRELFAAESTHGRIADLEVQRPSLESTYLTMVAGQEEVTR